MIFADMLDRINSRARPLAEPLRVPIRPPKPNIDLETLPPDGLISCYGACSGDEDHLDHYSSNYHEKMKLWFKSNKE